jgi:D-alanyl-D-alanine carboxypeptidase
MIEKEIDNKKSKKKLKKNSYSVLKRVVLCLIVLVIAITAALGVIKYTSQQPTAFAYAYDRNSPLLALENPQSIGIADSFAKDLCATTENISLSGVTLSENTSGALFDLTEQKVLFSKDIFSRRYPASLTKIMTAIVALKHGNLDDMVTVSQEAMNIDADSSVCNLKVGDRIKLGDLINGLLIQSGNDAANAIAEHIAGSNEAFVELMNQEAASLGATGTHFVNAHGLHDENHYTTVYDIYLIFNEAIKDESFVQILNETTYKAVVQRADGTTVDLSWIATNQYHTQETTPPKNVTVIGGKTGTTKAAGNCLVLLSKDAYGNPFISVIMNAEQKSTLYDEMNQLLSHISK